MGNCSKIPLNSSKFNKKKENDYNNPENDQDEDKKFDMRYSYPPF